MEGAREGRGEQEGVRKKEIFIQLTILKNGTKNFKQE
jgi:hypothetical protein